MPDFESIWVFTFGGHNQELFLGVLLFVHVVQRSCFVISDLNKKLEKVNEQGVKERDRLIESSKSLFTSREEAEHRMRYLKEKAARDLASFNAELKDLMRIIDHDRRLREFMTTKETDLSEVYDQVVQARYEIKIFDIVISISYNYLSY